MTDLPTDPQALADAYAAFERRVIAERVPFLAASAASSDTFIRENLAMHAHDLTSHGLTVQVNGQRRANGVSGAATRPNQWARSRWRPAGEPRP
jgi:hypothetical protein